MSEQRANAEGPFYLMTSTEILIEPEGHQFKDDLHVGSDKELYIGYVHVGK
jgi:hypothetical protein